MNPRPATDGRDRLIDAALRLFAEEGVDGVSIRAVNRAAGVGPAAVHYHFSSKDGLIDAVLLHHGDEVVEGITRQGDQLISRGDLSAADVVRLITQPYVELLRTHRESGLRWVKVIDHFLRRDPERVNDKRVSSVRQEVTRLAFPDADVQAIDRALTMSVRLFVGHIAQLTNDDVADAAGLDRTIEELQFLTDFLAGGMASTLSSEGAATR